ncbi:MAG: putative baseplate assembly protein [Gaiellaceae bacterium]
MKYACCDERRLQAVKEAGALNGIEYLEVSDSEAPSDALQQRTLFVRLLQPPPAFGPANVVVAGGERIATVGVDWVAPATTLPAGEAPSLVAGLEDPATVLLVRTSSRGDFSRYTLRLVAGAGSDAVPAGFDPLLAAVEFSFKVECPSGFDCGPQCQCGRESAEGPAIDYLAKDYGTFRALMLDRLSLLAPGWAERSPADVGVALVETLAYVADELSYCQDAVATEAYLATARRRASLRRHARLVDYLVHEGSNARAWMRVVVEAEGVSLDRRTPLLTRVPDVPAVVEPGGPAHRAALAAGAETFEIMDDAVLYESHVRFDFWTWGDAGCCLPRGATSATLVGDHPALRAGDVLVLAEVVGPITGQPEDADPARRAAVRLTHVVPSLDPSGGLFADPPTNASVVVTEIAWDKADALPFPLCISVEDQPGLVVGEAWGNVVLADHGRTIAGEFLGEVPEPVLSSVGEPACDPCERPEVQPVPARFRPTLASAPLTHARPAPTRVVAEGAITPALTIALQGLTFDAALHDWLEERGFSFEVGPAVVRGDDDVWSVSDGVTVALLRLDAVTGILNVLERPASAAATVAAAADAADARAARPAIELEGTLLAATEPWQPQADLLASDGGAAEFVVEVEHDGAATLRFGDGAHGRRPEQGTVFEATYRVGNGTAGNVGASAIAHVVTAQPGLLGVDNALAATGGVDAEPAEAVRRDAPEAFLVQQRAVTADDYALVTERSPLVQRAAARFRWTGSWHTVFVTADRAGGSAVDETFERGIRRHLEPFRMAGYDLEVDGPRFVPLEVGLHVCVEPDYFRSHVKAAVLDVLSSRVRPDGTLGFFHPDRFTFGQPVYLSVIVAAAQAVPGVQSVTATAFQRQRDDASSALDTGVLTLDGLEIARLDDDPSFPEHGVLVLSAGGGK